MNTENQPRTSRLVEGDTLHHSAPLTRPRSSTPSRAEPEDSESPDNALVTFHCPVYPADHRVSRHHHQRAQLLYAVEGIMIVETDDGSWTVPPEQAVWIPAGIAHAVRMPCEVHMRSLYFDPTRLGSLPARCRVVAVEPLLRELIARVVSPVERCAGRVARLVSVLLDEVRALESPALHLPTPQDPRLLRIAQTLIENPADSRDLDAWATSVGASTRTLARLFRREVGMGFSAWRRQLRLITAVQRLGTGSDVTTVALDLGYRSPSAFIAMFRRSLGETPARYIRR